ncbi:MAG: adenylate cyclase [Gemmatales bacterium]|nr:MAG: adenylate cyclase [Gemmatales bacterium]
MIDYLLPYLLELRLHFRVTDAIDILLMAVLLYLVLHWCRENSRRVLVGVTVLIVIYFLARSFDMYLTSQVFHAGFTALVIVLSVIFQDDARRMFERLSSWGAWRESRRSETASATNAVLVQTVFQLAENKTGALIVLQGKEALDRHLEGGISLQGRISKPLLLSIFDTSSPGHDGAVVLKGDRIESFAVHLPISKNHKVLAGRGTRHAAALGLSERCDALVIVVSEERRVVSVAENGTLKEVGSAPQLLSRLDRFFECVYPEKNHVHWRRFVFENWPMKCLALFFAAAAWYIVGFNPNTVVRTFVVPVEYRNVPPNLAINEGVLETVHVTCSGSERDFRFLDASSLKIAIDLANRSPGIHEIEFSARNIRLPPGIEIYRIEPASVELELQPRKPVSAKTPGQR